jgi:hypothetical protein
MTSANMAKHSNTDNRPPVEPGERHTVADIFPYWSTVHERPATDYPVTDSTKDNDLFNKEPSTSVKQFISTNTESTAAVTVDITSDQVPDANVTGGDFSSETLTEDLTTIDKEDNVVTTGYLLTDTYDNPHLSPPSQSHVTVIKKRTTWRDLLISSQRLPRSNIDDLSTFGEAVDFEPATSITPIMTTPTTAPLTAYS